MKPSLEIRKRRKFKLITQLPLVVFMKSLLRKSRLTRNQPLLKLQSISLRKMNQKIKEKSLRR
jgi:hypothetical protein